MAWTYTYDTATPAGTDSPTQGDDRIREVKAALQERLNADHYMPLTGTAVSDTDAGKHRQVTFVAPISTPTPDTDEGILYTKTIATKSELCFAGEDGAEKQLTTYDTSNTVQCLNIEKKDLIVNESDLVDDDTIEVDSTNGLQLKAGGAGTGILKTHLGTDAGDFVDDATIENDGTNGLQLKVPAAGADADYCGVPVIAGGDYSGQDTDLTITAFNSSAIKIKKLVIRSGSEGSSDSGVEFIVTDTGTKGWNQVGIGLNTDVSITDHQFTLTGNKLKTCQSGRSYTWYAEGVWAAGS